MPGGIQQRIPFAQHLADVAGGIIRPYFRSQIAISDKGHSGFFDPVTEADRRTEQAIRAEIGREFPQDGIIGEEFGENPGTTGFTWVIDPIDGTRSFVVGQTLWGTLIGLEQDGQPALGVLDQPILRERFTGMGDATELHSPEAFLRLHTRHCGSLGEAIITTTHPMTYFNEAERTQFHRLERACQFSRYGGDCYAYALLAMGFIDLVVEARLKHWDVAALIPIVHGAGGIFTNWSGGPALRGGSVIAAGDARIHAAAVEILSGPP